MIRYQIQNIKAEGLPLDPPDACKYDAVIPIIFSRFVTIPVGKGRDSH